jgi:glutamate formiminotransferase/formiminotetrahydrofolate cyclodeaminase
MVAGLTVGRKKYAAVEVEMKALALEATTLGNALNALVDRDAEAYARVMEAYALPKETDAQGTERTRAIDAALLGAALVPLETARACTAVAALAEHAARLGNPNCVSDAGVAALLAEAGCRGAAYNVRINVASLSDRASGASLLGEAAALVVQARQLAEATTTTADSAIGD